MDAADFNPQRGQVYIVALTHDRAAHIAHAMVRKNEHEAIATNADGQQLTWFHLVPSETDLIARAKHAGATVVEAED